MRFSMKQLMIAVFLISLTMYAFFVVPSLRLDRFKNRMHSLVVFVKKSEKRWPEFQNGAFELSGTDAQTFLNNMFESAKLDSSRFACKFELFVFSLDENRNCMGGIVVRNENGYTFDRAELDTRNPLRPFVEMAQKGAPVSQADFELIRSKVDYRDFVFSIGQEKAATE